MFQDMKFSFKALQHKFQLRNNYATGQFNIKEC